MRTDQAEAIVRTVERAWDWVMATQTFEIWRKAIAELADPEAAELAVVELYKHQAQRPRLADIIEAYRRMRERIVAEAPQQPRLAAPKPDDHWSIEGARRAAGMHRIGGTKRRPMLIPDDEIAAAEVAAYESWTSRGATRAERISSVKAEISALVAQLVERDRAAPPRPPDPEVRTEHVVPS